MLPVMVDDLGICEFCNEILDMRAVATDSWNCTRCNEHVAQESFGIRQETKSSVKHYRWVGPDGKWTHIRPEVRFILGEFQVHTKLP
jgi:hypothetical protein